MGIQKRWLILALLVAAILGSLSEWGRRIEKTKRATSENQTAYWRQKYQTDIHAVVHETVVRTPDGREVTDRTITTDTRTVGEGSGTSTTARTTVDEKETKPMPESNLDLSILKKVDGTKIMGHASYRFLWRFQASGAYVSDGSAFIGAGIRVNL